MSSTDGNLKAIPVMVAGLREIQELHYLESRIVIGLANDHCGKCREDWPCATRRAADKALGDAS